LSNQNKVVKFKKRKTINIGVIIFLVLFLYIAINVYLYLTKEQLTIYEVQEGTTAVDNKITAMILRQETLINSGKAGYVLYYQKDGERVAKNESIYSISDNEIYNAGGNDATAIVLNKKNDSLLSHTVRSFRNSYSDSDYSKVYAFKDSAKSTILDILNNSLVSEEQNSGLVTGAVASDQSGIITYYSDNYETVTVDNFTADMFHEKNYKKTSLRTTDKISQNTPVYKMVNSDTWNLVAPLTKDQYNELKDTDKVKITVLEDGDELSAKLSFANRGSKQYAVLTMNRDMANYLGERFLDIKIDFDYAEGLKIPNTAIVKKDFYEVPLTYFIQGGDSKETGLVEVLYDETGKTKTQFVATDIYDKNKTYGYVDSNLFKAGTPIQPQGGTETYTLSKTKKLSGVYNVNLGYAVFKQIDILYQDEEYSIIKDNTEFGLSAYDHIVLDGKIAEEQKIIY
jgi:hypothetical protein